MFFPDLMRMNRWNSLVLFSKSQQSIGTISTKLFFWLFFKVLITKGANVDAVEVCCRTALIFAAHHGYSGVVEALIDAGNKKKQTKQLSNAH